jgi:hypothetical protein
MKYGRQLALTLVPAGLVLLGLAGAARLLDASVSTLSLDIAAVASVHPLTGALSSLSVLLWCTAAVTCGFAAVVVWGERPAVSGASAGFLATSSAVSLYLLFDDLFEVHEYLAPRYASIEERFVLGLLGLVVVAYLVGFRRDIARTPWVMLAIALGLLATSAFIDVAFATRMASFGPWHLRVQVGAKWIGIACWCSYYVRTAYRAVAGPRLPRTNRGPA